MWCFLLLGSSQVGGAKRCLPPPTCCLTRDLWCEMKTHITAALSTCKRAEAVAVASCNNSNGMILWESQGASPLIWIITTSARLLTSLRLKKFTSRRRCLFLHSRTLSIFYTYIFYALSISLQRAACVRPRGTGSGQMMYSQHFSAFWEIFLKYLIPRNDVSCYLKIKTHKDQDLPNHINMLIFMSCRLIGFLNEVLRVD